MLINPYVFAGFDVDALAYLTGVEAADGQGLETGVRTAINTFVVGCKSDGTWTAIKASLILAGARTLTGALVPLVGTAPTSFNFVSGDYNRKTGLAGDASTKYLDSNRNNNAEPQNSKHISGYVSSFGSTSQYIMGYSGAVNGNTSWVINSSTYGNGFRINNLTQTSTLITAGGAGFVGASRSSGSSIDIRTAGSTTNQSSTSSTPISGNISIYRRTVTPAGTYTNARLAFYSIGESLDLALLDSRVTTLINAIAAAIP